MSDNQVPVQNAFQLIATNARDLRFTIKGPLIPGSSFNFQLNDQIDRISDGQNRMFQVTFKIEINTTPDIITLSTIYCVVFKCENEITDAFITSPIIQINAKAIAFPFVRSFVSTITANCGIPPVILPALNFAKRTHA